MADSSSAGSVLRLKAAYAAARASSSAASDAAPSAMRFRRARAADFSDRVNIIPPSSSTGKVYAFYCHFNQILLRISRAPAHILHSDPKREDPHGAPASAEAPRRPEHRQAVAAVRCADVPVSRGQAPAG